MFSGCLWISTVPPGLPLGSKEGAALGRKIVIHADIRDHITAFVIVALHAQSELRPDRRSRAVGGEHVFRVEAVVADG
jgi:hypothetical protein